MRFFISIILIVASFVVYAADEEEAKLLKEVLGEEQQNTDETSAGSEIRFLLKPSRSAIFSAKMEGTISKLALVAGSHFKKGDILVKINCAMREAEYEFNLAQKESVKYEYKTNQILRKSNSVGKLKLYKSEQEFKKAEAKTKASMVLLDECVIKAPYSGRVAKVYNKQYQYVKVGQELVEIFDDNIFEMKMLVPSSWLGQLNKGDTFDAKLDETNEVFKAEIKRISPKIDSVSKTVPLTAVLIKEPKLKLYGMSGVAYIKPQLSPPQVTE